MPTVEHVIEHTPGQDSYRAAAVRGSFDFSAATVSRSWSVEIPDESEPWQIGVIVGPSGSGKTQLARKLYAEKMSAVPSWRASCMLDDFPEGMQPEEVTALLSSVGLGSVPSWFLPYASLSTGQRFRADMARRIADAAGGSLIVVDEFSSVVDRTVAKTTSAVVASRVRKLGLRFVAVTCHDDVIEWLCPDWILDMATGRLARGCLQRRPSIALDIREVSRDAWWLFKAHHYLSADLCKTCRCYLGTVDDVPAVFVALILYPHVQRGLVTRIHRVVTLPDFQGHGLAQGMMRELACREGRAVYISTTHAAFARSMRRNPDWALTRGRSFVPSASASCVGHRSTVLSVGFRFAGRREPDSPTERAYRNTASARRDGTQQSPSTGGQ